IADRYATPVLQVDLRNATTWGSDDVSCSGAACPTVGNGGATFNQVDHLVATAPDLTGDSFAFATWIRPQTRNFPMSDASATAFGKWTDADYQGVFGYQPTTDSDEIFPSLFVGDNGRLRMIWGDGTTTCEVASANTGILAFDDTWQHLVVNYDGSNLTFYVNGEPIPGGTTGSCAAVSPPDVSSFYIGRPNDFGYLYFNEITFENFSDTHGTGQSAEMRLNLNSDSSSGSLAWQNHLANDTTTLWTLNKTAVANDSNAWFRVWENNDGGCFITCPEDNSTDTNFDQDWGHADISLLHVTGINNTTYLGEQSSRVRTDYCGVGCTPTVWGLLDWSNYNDFFMGTLDDFRVYGNALTDAAIADMFRATSMALDLPFDEAPGSDVFGDQSGNAISVSCSGSTCPTSGVPGRFNQSLSFDGVDDFLTIGTSSTALGTSEGSFTAMMWIKPDTFWGTNDSGTLPLLEVGDNYYLGLQGYGRLSAFTGSFNAWTSNFTLYNATGRWHHLAYVFENGTYKFYVNGAYIDSGTLDGPQAANTLRIGRNNNYYFDGLLDDLIVVDRALTNAEIDAYLNRVPAVNLHLDEGLKTDNGIIVNQSINTFRDDSESRYMATCADANTCPDAGDKGQMRESVTFDGNDMLTLSDTSAMALTDFSVGMWVKPTATSATNQWLATKSTPSFTSANLRLFLEAQTLTVRFDREDVCGGGGWPFVEADNPLIANQWNHVLATHDATNGEMKIYVNGRLAGVTSGIGSSLCTDAYPIRLGQGYDGGMDEVIITPSVLDAETVAALYNYQAAWYDLFNPYALFVDADLPTVDLSLTPETVGTAETVLF
ncbi:MAG: LamG domain-containing protein, partial [Anaerolineales bacterium]|nr:LamG domain-containing protein [Anaerolineales bacterium]